MTSTKNFKTLASSLILVSIIIGITLTSAIAEDNYKNDNNFLTNISENTFTENGYKANIIINPSVAGIYSTESGYKLDLTINPNGIGGSLKESNYQINLIPEKTFPDIADIAVTNIMLSKTVVGQGYTALINVAVSNKAFNYETFHVIIQANTTIIKTQTITLTSMNNAIITFTWNTTDYTKGKYIISAYACPIPGEINTANNNLTNGIIMVTIPGDCAGTDPMLPPWCDGKVFWQDLLVELVGYGATPADPRWTNYNLPRADFNNDNQIFWQDLLAVLINYGKSDP